VEIIGCVWFLKNLFICYLIARFVKYVNIPVEITLPLSWVILLIIPYGGTLMINFLYFYFAALSLFDVVFYVFPLSLNTFQNLIF